MYGCPFFKFSISLLEFCFLTCYLRLGPWNRALACVCVFRFGKSFASNCYMTFMGSNLDSPSQTLTLLPDQRRSCTGLSAPKFLNKLCGVLNSHPQLEIWCRARPTGPRPRRQAGWCPRDCFGVTVLNWTRSDGHIQPFHAQNWLAPHIWRNHACARLRSSAGPPWPHRKLHT